MYNDVCVLHYIVSFGMIVFTILRNDIVNRKKDKKIERLLLNQKSVTLFC